MGKKRDSANKVAFGLRIVLISSLVLFLLATATEYYRSPGTQVAAPPTDKSIRDLLIVPGARIGPITLGLSLEQMLQELGNGQKRPLPNGVLYLYEEVGLVIYTEDERVASVTTRSPMYTTRQGIKVGDDIDSVLSHLGRDYELEGDSEEKYVLHNWSQGWHVGVEKSVVTYFQVTPPMKS